MATPFATLESRVTDAALKHIANKTASAYDAYGQALSFTVIFDAASEVLFGGMVSDVGPQVMCKTADVADAVWDSGITVGVTAYTVANIHHDGTGVTTLSLREA